MKRGKEILIVFAAVVIFGCVSYVWAEDPNEVTTPPEPTPAVEPEPEAVTIRGMQVFLDRETGKMRPPTAKEAAVLSRMMTEMFGKRRSEPQLNVDKNGIGSIELSERFMEFSMARIGADGKLTMDCVDGIDGARAYVEAAATPSKSNAGLEEE